VKIRFRKNFHKKDMVYHYLINSDYVYPSEMNSYVECKIFSINEVCVCAGMGGGKTKEIHTQ